MTVALLPGGERRLRVFEDVEGLISQLGVFGEVVDRQRSELGVNCFDIVASLLRHCGKHLTNLQSEIPRCLILFLNLSQLCINERLRHILLNLSLHFF